MSSSAVSNKAASGPLVATFLKRRASAWIVTALTAVGYLVGFLLRPKLGDSTIRSSYANFFIISVTVVAAIFIAFAVASREVTSNVQLGVTTVLALATSTLGGLLDLLPAAHQPAYGIGFVLLIGGGIGGLCSTSLIAIAGLVTAREGRREAMLEALRTLSDEASKPRESDAS
jgi:hypothetical protein